MNYFCAPTKSKTVRMRPGGSVLKGDRLTSFQSWKVLECTPRTSTLLNFTLLCIDRCKSPYFYGPANRKKPHTNCISRSPLGPHFSNIVIQRTLPFLAFPLFAILSAARLTSLLNGHGGQVVVKLFFAPAPFGFSTS